MFHQPRFSSTRIIFLNCFQLKNIQHYYRRHFEEETARFHLSAMACHLVPREIQKKFLGNLVNEQVEHVQCFFLLM